MRAYLASALSGLGSDQRQVVFLLSDLISGVCREHGIELYEPRMQTDPVHHASIPDKTVFWTDRVRVTEADLLVILGIYPSMGVGVELDFAYNSLLPVILVTHQDTRVSRMVTGTPVRFFPIVFSAPEDLRHSLRRTLAAVRPLMERRRTTLEQSTSLEIGTRIRRLRESLGLTRAKLADLVPCLSEEALENIEESSDTCANVSITQLMQICQSLNTTVGDLFKVY